MFAFPKLLRTRKTSIQERIVFVVDTLPLLLLPTSVLLSSCCFNFAAVVRATIVADVTVINIDVPLSFLGLFVDEVCGKMEKL